MKKNKSNIINKKKERFRLFLEKPLKTTLHTKKMETLKTEIENLIKNKSYKKMIKKKMVDVKKKPSLRKLVKKRKSEKYKSSRKKEDTKKIKSKKKSILRSNHKNIFNFKLLKKKSSSIKRLIEKGLLSNNKITKHLQENLGGIFLSKNKNKKNKKKNDLKKPAKNMILKSKSKSKSVLKKKKIYSEKNLKIKFSKKFFKIKNERIKTEIEINKKSNPTISTCYEKNNSSFSKSRKKYKKKNLLCIEKISKLIKSTNETHKKKTENKFIIKNKKKNIKNILKSFSHEKYENNYSSITLHYLISQENIYSPNPHYIKKTQKHIKWQMRAFLINWIQEVTSEFMFKRETFHYSVNFFDRFLTKNKNIKKKNIQLIGLTALFLASKVEEVYTPKVENMTYICDGAYTKKKILLLENKMLRILNYNITPPTLNLWAKWTITQWDFFLKSEQGVNHFFFKDKDFIFFKKSDIKSYILFRKLMQLIDTALFDYKTLQYKNRAVVCSFIYILLGLEYKQFLLTNVVNDFCQSDLYLLDEKFAFNNLFDIFLKKFFGFFLKDLFFTIQYCSTFFGLEFNMDYPLAYKTMENDVSKGHFEDFLAYQTFNPNSLQFVLEERVRDFL